MVKKEMVERDFRLVAHNFSLRDADTRCQGEACEREHKRDPEQDGEVARCRIDPYSGRRGYSHSKVVAQPVIADSLVAPRRRQHVDSHGRVGHCGGAERYAVHSAHDGKHQQSARANIACETQEKILAAMIPDGNYFYYHAFLAYSNRMKAGHLVRAERYDKAIAALRSSLKHSVLYDEFIEGKSMYRFTSPFFDRAEYCTDDICRTGFTTQREDFYEAVKHSPFDRLAEMKEFKELMQ